MGKLLPRTSGCDSCSCAFCFASCFWCCNCAAACDREDAVSLSCACTRLALSRVVALVAPVPVRLASVVAEEVCAAS